MRLSSGPFTKGLLLHSKEQGEKERKRIPEGTWSEKSERKKQRCVRRRRIETRRNERENERARERERETERRRRRATAIHVETSEWEAICGESRSIRHSSSVSGIPRSPNRRRFLSPTHPFCLFPFSSPFFLFLFLFSSLYIRQRVPRYYENKRTVP